MAFANNAMIIRRVLLERLVRSWKKDTLLQDIDRLPIELTPKNSKARGRCCIHKERAVWKYKTFPLLGFDPIDERDELTPLSYYAKVATTRQRNSNQNILCVVDEACSACIHTKYVVTDLCRGCVARPCYMNCPKEAISFKYNGKAKIAHDKCVNCGICKEACPYHTIIYIPVPCEEVCPVKAISKDADGIEHIDESKCIYCGKCINACPFGSIFELSQVFDILSSIKRGDEVVAICAPSILGQYNSDMTTIFSAIKAIGFTDVIEVAHGAMETTRREAVELKEKIEAGEPFMTTSCCPSYVALVEKHIPDLKKFVSHTGSPMYYSARMAKEQYPNAKIVFVGPCVAKRREAQLDEAVNYVLTFEEIDSMIKGHDIDLATVPQYQFAPIAQKEGRGFALAGGVAAAVDSLKLIPDLKYLQISNLNKKNIGLLRAYGKGKSPVPFIEVMACEGGCVTGPSANLDGLDAKKYFSKNFEAHT